MEDLVETVTRGNVTEVKVVLTSVVAALAVYQVLLMAVGYGKLRPPFLSPAPASATHRAVGDSIVLVTVARPSRSAAGADRRSWRLSGHMDPKRANQRGIPA